MKKSILLIILLSGVLTVTLMNNLIAQKNKTKLKALIIDGENNHGVWPKTTMMMKDFLE